MDLPKKLTELDRLHPGHQGRSFRNEFEGITRYGVTKSYT